MAWRPYENLIDGELDNQIPGRVSGWIRFYRKHADPLRLSLDLEGDFEHDIRGWVIRLRNPCPSDFADQLGWAGTYVERFVPNQRGRAGNITAGFPIPYSEELIRRLLVEDEDYQWLTGNEREKHRRQFLREHRSAMRRGELFEMPYPYPYIEWFGETNGQVVLELPPSQLSVVGAEMPERPELPPGTVGGERAWIKDIRKLFEDIGGEVS